MKPEELWHEGRRGTAKNAKSAKDCMDKMEMNKRLGKLCCDTIVCRLTPFTSAIFAFFAVNRLGL
jgi:hypothetical protein